MTYIDDIAARIAEAVGAFDQDPQAVRAGGDGEGADSDPALYRLYAVLCLAKGVETTSRDVHDAWAAWRAGSRPDHPALVPFACLPPAVQAADDPYRDAIHAVARAPRPA